MLHIPDTVNTIAHDVTSTVSSLAHDVAARAQDAAQLAADRGRDVSKQAVDFSRHSLESRGVIKKQSGRSALSTLLTIAIVAVLGAVAFKLIRRKQTPTTGGPANEAERIAKQNHVRVA